MLTNYKIIFNRLSDEDNWSNDGDSIEEIRITMGPGKELGNDEIFLKDGVYHIPHEMVYHRDFTTLVGEEIADLLRNSENTMELIEQGM